MQIDRRLISHFDWTLFFLSLAFVAVGVMTIYSANYDVTAGHAGPLPMRQVTWLGLGLIAMFAAISFDYHYIDRLAYPFYGTMLLLLLLVLIVGLTKAGELDPGTAHDWTQASRGKKAELDKDAMTETLLQYKGAEAGEVDWRPTETIPEDYYAM